MITHLIQLHLLNTKPFHILLQWWDLKWYKKLAVAKCTLKYYPPSLMIRSRSPSEYKLHGSCIHVVKILVVVSNNLDSNSIF